MIFPTHLKIYRGGAKAAKGRKVEWDIEKTPVLLRVPLRPLRLCGFTHAA